MKSYSAKLLFCRSTAITIDAAVRNRHSARLYYNLDNVFTLQFEMVGLGKYTSIIDYFVWNVLQLFVEIINPNHRKVIVDANVYLTSLRIGEAGHPFQVLVFPDSLMLDILIFLIHCAKLSKNTGTHKDMSH